MNLRSSWLGNGLIAALALGTSVLVAVTGEKPTTDELDERARNLLPAFPRAELRAISLKRGDESYSIRAEAPQPGDGSSGEERFVFAGGEPLEVDPDALTALLRSLELAGHVRRLDPDAEDRVALGLSAPSAILSVEFRDARYELRFGKEALTPAGTRYLEVVGPDAPQTYLVRSELANELLVEKDALRPKTLLRVPFAELRALRWREGSGASKEVLRVSGVEFTNRAGERLRRDTLDRLGLELTRAKSVRFIPLSAGRAALSADPSALEVTLSPGGEAPESVFRVGGRCPDDPALEVLERERPTPSAECVPPELRQSFRVAANALTDDSPFALHPDEVESLRLERQSKTLELVRKDRAFRLTTPTDQDVELESGNGRLDELVRARGERVEKPNLSELGLSLPEGRVRLRSSVVEGSPAFEEVVEIGRLQRDGRLPVRRVKDGAILLLSAEAAAAYEVDSTLLKSRRLFDFGPSELKTLTLELEGERETLRRVEDSYQLVEPKGFEHDGERVLDLVQGLATLLADRWVTDHVEAQHGLAEPKARLILELETKGAPKRVSLSIGADTAGGAFGALDTQPGVFVLPRAFVNQATRRLLSRAVFEVDASTLSAIAISSPRGSLELRRTGDRFETKTGALSAPAVERITKALENLHAETALHTGPARPAEGFDAPLLTLRLTPADTSQKPKHIRIGSAVTQKGEKLFHARVDGADATYLLPASALDELLNTL